MFLAYHGLMILHVHPMCGVQFPWDPRQEDRVARILAHWVLSALCLLLVAHFVPGFFVRGIGTALIAAVVIGLVNGTLGLLLKIVTFPLTVITFGIFWLLINALMLKLAALAVPGFEVQGLWPAFFGGLILSLLNLTIRQVLRGTRDRADSGRR